ncbi:HAMP domain-containing sensor histidine kinase [Paenibacillus oryzisoli]|uniref:sensor histidine kinase n=1 Tax=Paenibacillus oryzisoli TaxID=1850517 RepID=UPI003D29C85D
MANIMRSFRFKMLMLLGLSMGLSGTLVYLLYKALQIYYAGVRREDSLARVRRAIYEFGDLNFFLLLFIPLAIMFFFFLTKPYAAYFREISTGLRRLAQGDFAHRVHLESNDEFQAIAADINMAGENLQKAMERGDFAESSKDRLVLNLAHDLRTPLTSVLGYLDLLLRDEGLTREQAVHYTTIAFTKSKRLERLIDELFEITRMNYGRLELEKRELDLSELLAQLQEELYPMMESSGLDVRLELASQVKIAADGELLARVFENLLTNACRYGQDGQFVDIRCFVEAGEAVVQIVNYGDVIPREELPRLFEMFYIGDRARSHREGGTGLGLFIAKNIVEQHGGTISAHSSVACTRFEVRLPQ